MVTPMTQRYFGFTELGNSLMYGVCGVEVILGFFLVRWLSRRVADRVVLAVGLAVCGVACVWCLIFLTEPRGEEDHTDGRLIRVTWVGTWEQFYTVQKERNAQSGISPWICLCVLVQVWIKHACVDV